MVTHSFDADGTAVRAASRDSNDLRWAAGLGAASTSTEP